MQTFSLLFIADAVLASAAVVIAKHDLQPL
jgi:hypothetical protein